MTLPDERYRAVVQTQKFLVEILSTPRVPKVIKDILNATLMFSVFFFGFLKFSKIIINFLNFVSKRFEAGNS